MAVKFDVRTYKYQVTLPGLVVDYEAPYGFYLPRALRDMTLGGYEPLTMAAFLASIDRAGPGPGVRTLPKALRVLLTRLRGPEGVVFDIGANIGLYAMLAAAVGKACVAFEPSPDPAMVLEDIGQRYRLPITVRQVAMAERPGRAQLYLSMNSDMSHSLNPEFRKHVGELEVEASTSDAEARKARPAVIKIDTESTEMDVLRGGEATLRNVRPFVLLELLTADANDDAHGYFRSLGYTLYPLGKPETWKGTSAAPAAEGDRRNWLAAPAPLGERFFEAAAGYAEMIAKLPKPL